MDATAGTVADRLSVDAAEQTYRVRPGETLSFGRAAAAVVDPDNPYMHRIVGRLTFDRAYWWLHNSARHMPLTMIGDDDRLKTLPAGAAEPLTTTQGAIRFYAGAVGYELTWELDGPVETPASDTSPVSLDEATADFGRVVLSTDQRRIMVAMAEPRLLDPGRNTRIPANAELAARFGWTLKQFDRRLDYLCRKLTRSGVPGLVGNPGAEAADRRQRLVRHVLHNGLITIDDLDLLGPPPDDGGDEGHPLDETSIVGAP